MHYKKYRPAKELERFVQCYYIWEGTQMTPVDIESPPSALCSLVINFKSPYSISNYKYTRYPAPLCFVSGQALKNYTLHLSGDIGIAGVVLKPTAVYNFFGIPMFELTGERMCLSKINTKLYESLPSQIKEAEQHKQKIALLEKGMLGLLETKSYSTPEITDNANNIYKAHGKINIVDLLKRIPMSRRNFERKFLEEVGISPKTYAKIRRFGYTCSLMAGNRDVNLMDVLHEGGYYDQSHFIKDFKYFSGRTPRKYAKTNVELANYVDGIALVERKLHEAERQPS